MKEYKGLEKYLTEYRRNIRKNLERRASEVSDEAKNTKKHGTFARKLKRLLARSVGDVDREIISIIHALILWVNVPSSTTKKNYLAEAMSHFLLKVDVSKVNFIQSQQHVRF
jgi:hypothetical protein